MKADSEMLATHPCNHLLVSQHFTCAYLLGHFHLLGVFDQSLYSSFAVKIATTQFHISLFRLLPLKYLDLEPSRTKKTHIKLLKRVCARMDTEKPVILYF